MNMKHWAAAVAALMTLSGTAQAALFDRGGGMVYDDVLKITWLADWNYAKTSGYDADGMMNWTDASNWASKLVYGGYSDWRLPTALNANGSGPCGGFNCSGSELGHMFYTNWGASAGNNFATGTNTASLRLFTNVQSFVYWSGTVHASLPGVAWGFNTNFGSQGNGTASLFAVAVRPGDVITPPPPARAGQILYLEFAETLAPTPVAANSLLRSYLASESGVFTKPNAGLSATEERQVVANVQSVFKDFNITVTSTRPVDQQYSTIYIGGAINDLPPVFAKRLAGRGILGVAENIDVGNESQTDVAHVFTAEIDRPVDGSFLSKVSQATAHEAAHIMGLQHVLEIGQLMYRFDANDYRSLLSNRCIDVVNRNGCQNSFQELGRAVGFSSGLTPDPLSLRERQARVFARWQTVGEALFFINDARLLIEYSSDAGPTIVNLGNLTINDLAMLELRLHGATRFTIVGAALPGGALDTVVSPMDLTSFEGLSFGDIPLDDLYLDLDEDGRAAAKIYRQLTSGAVDIVGQIELSSVTAVYEPAALGLAVPGLIVVMVVARRRRGEGLSPPARRRCLASATEFVVGPAIPRQPA